MRTLPVLGAAGALTLLAACIERPPSPRDVRIKFDRSRLGDVLLREPPSPQKRVGAMFGDAVELVGLDWHPQTPKPGDAVAVDFYYRVAEESEDDYKIFVHIDDRGGRSERINADHWPAGGHYPVRAWRRGDLIRDQWTFKVPSYYTGEALDLFTGFYPPGKDDRWPITNREKVQHDGQNRVLAATIPMR
jgi:hypothetical protein